MQSVNVEILINGKKYAGELKEVEEAAAGTTTSDNEKRLQANREALKEAYETSHLMNEEHFRSWLYSGNSKSSENQMKMYETFVRVYHMNNGKKYVAGSYYPSEQLAVEHLHIFNPAPEGVPDFSNVDYITIEKRYTPKPAVDMNWIVDQEI